MAADLLYKICTVSGDRTYFISLHTKHSHCAQEKCIVADVKEQSYVEL